MNVRRATWLTTLALLPIAACGGDDPKPDPGDLNLGTYDTNAFAYRDPYPDIFHPLGSKTYRAARREELVALAASSSATGYAVGLDDAGQKHAQLGLFGPVLFEAGFGAMASAGGTLDAARGDDLAVVGRRGNDLEIVALTTNEKGEWSRIGKGTITGSSQGFRAVDLTLSDIDGDELDEAIVCAAYAAVAGGWIRIYDDPQSGFQLLYNSDIGGAGRIEATSFDADGDGSPEILLFCRELSRATVRLIEGAAKQFAFRGQAMAVHPWTEQVVIGNFDDDPAPELGLIAVDLTNSGGSACAMTYDFTESGLAVLETSDVIAGYRLAFDTVALDTNGDHVDEIFSIMLGYESGKNDGRWFHWAPAADRAERPSPKWVLMPTSYPYQASLVVHDNDADGRDDLGVFINSNSSGLAILDYTAAESQGQLRLFPRGTRFAPVPAGTVSVTVAAGDFDRENLVLRSTGRKWLDLPDPMPIAVLAAPPTRSGISQNYDESSTSYGTEQSSERSHGVTTGWTASFSVGFEAHDIFDLFSASVKETLTWEMDKTLTQSQRTTWTKTFAGSYDHDVIVFQGTLYKVYEYEIIGAANPQMIGAKVTLNDPVATKTFKWTVDFYNQQVSEKARIGRDVLCHEIGKPSSYCNRAGAQSLLQQRYGWLDTGLEVGAVRGGSNTTSVTVSEKNSTETSRRFGVDLESEIKIGGATIGGSFGLSSADIYSVTVESGTTYAGRVGDIESSSQWLDWHYSFGLLVYRQGADATGRPERGKRPFHVVTYWVDDLGPGHRGR